MQETLSGALQTRMKRHWMFFAALSYSTISHAGTVIAITDGDTLKVLQNGQQIKVRLANIDAPEKRQAFGQRSKQSLSDICFGKDAQLDAQNIDRYGRTVAVVTCAGTQANQAQVERGMAWVYRRYNRDKTLPALQELAKAAKRGLWADTAPLPPWLYRKRK